MRGATAPPPSATRVSSTRGMAEIEAEQPLGGALAWLRGVAGHATWEWLSRRAALRSRGRARFRQGCGFSPNSPHSARSRCSRPFALHVLKVESVY